MTDRRRCASCGTLLYLCPECGEWFVKTNSKQEVCRQRCRQRKSKRIKEKAPE